MHISFAPRLQSADQVTPPLDALLISRDGTSLIINGETYPLGDIPNGGLLPDGLAATGCPYIAGPIERAGDGKLHITLLLPCGFDAPNEARFPQPIIDPPDGPVALPDTRWPPPALPAPQQQGERNGNG